MESNGTMLAEYVSHGWSELVDMATAMLHGDRMEAEDVVQSVVLRLLTAACIIDKAALPALARASVRHAVCDIWRRREHQKAYELLTLHTSQDSSDDPMSIVSASQACAMLEQEIARLPKNTARVVRMSMIDDMRTADIATMTGKSIKTIENQLNTGRKAIRQRMRQLMAG